MANLTILEALNRSLIATKKYVDDKVAEANASGGYTHPDSHPASMITGLATVATSGDYNDLTDKPTIPSAYTHPNTHPASMITGLSKVATSGSYNDLSNKPTIPTIPNSLPANGGNADTVNNFRLWKGTQAQYDAITTKDSNTIYMITE